MSNSSYDSHRPGSEAIPGKDKKQVETSLKPGCKILIADEHPLFRQAISSVIASDFECSEIIETSGMDNVLEITRKNEGLSLVLLDLDMPGMHGLDGLITLRNEAPTIPVVIVSAKENKQVALQAITYGAVGFIIKSFPRAQMTDAIYQIFSGKVYLQLHTNILHPGTHDSKRQSCFEGRQVYPELLNSLTHRQLLVLERMARGESNKQIACNLYIAETTVKGHVSAVFRKLGVHNRVQAILAAGNVDISRYLKRNQRFKEKDHWSSYGD